MSETLRDLVVSLSLNSDNFTRNIKSINKQIQEAESAFRLASAGVENFETTTAGLSAKLSTLQRTFQLQQDAVGQPRPQAGAVSRFQASGERDAGTALLGVGNAQPAQFIDKQQFKPQRGGGKKRMIVQNTPSSGGVRRDNPDAKRDSAG